MLRELVNISAKGVPITESVLRWFYPILALLSILNIIPATNQEMLPDLRPLSFSFSVRIQSDVSL